MNTLHFSNTHFYRCFHHYFYDDKNHTYSCFRFKNFQDLRNFISDITDNQYGLNSHEAYALVTKVSPNVQSNIEFKHIANESDPISISRDSLLEEIKRRFRICNKDGTTSINVYITTTHASHDSSEAEYYIVYLDAMLPNKEYTSSLYNSILFKVFMYGGELHVNTTSSLGEELVDKVFNTIKEQLDKDYLINFDNLEKANNWIHNFTDCYQIAINEKDALYKYKYDFKLNTEHNEYRHETICDLAKTTVINKLIKDTGFSLQIGHEYDKPIGGITIRVINQDKLNHPKIKNLFYCSLLHGAKLL